MNEQKFNTQIDHLKHNKDILSAQIIQIKGIITDNYKWRIVLQNC